ncbi:type I polyketide synthase, partial [Mycolicibacillus parakoreensis]
HTTRPPTTPHPPEPHILLPTTPWHHTHHWTPLHPPTPPTSGSAPRPGTLLGAVLTVAATVPTRLWQTRLVPQAKPYPGSHRLHGVEVVPASVLVATVAEAAAECGASALTDLRFEQPVLVDQPRQIQVVADGATLTVSSRPDTDEQGHRWVRHLCADIDAAGEAGGMVDAAVDGQPWDVDGLLDGWGVEGQPFAWSIEALRGRINGVAGLTAEVGLPEDTTVALLDAATHLARLVDRADQRLMVPAGALGVRLGAAPTGGRGVIEVRRSSGAATPSSAGAATGTELVVDIVGKTADGERCFEIRGLRYVDVESGPVAIADGADPRTFVHGIDWRPQPVDAAPTGGSVAVVGGGDAVALQNRLAESGYRHGEPADADHVVYLADTTVDTGIDAAVRMAGEVRDLLRGLDTRDAHRDATLWVLTRGVHRGEAETTLSQSSLWGLAAVAAAEHPDHWGGLLDLPADRPVGDQSAVLAAVLPTRNKTPLVLRDGEVYAPALAPLSGPPEREPVRCRPDAAYLITGGLGALGLLMAAWLVDRGARRLILAGRRGLPARRDWDGADGATGRTISAIRDLERRGVTIDIAAVDVGSREAVAELLDRRDRAGAPPIGGVIHAAGVTENALLTETSDAALRRVLWPKIAAATVLHEVFPPGTLDFLFLTASAGAVFGVPGQGAYAAANAYLDGLARLRRRHGDHTVSLDWVAWQGLGFAADAAIAVDELQRLGSRPVSADEAFAAWEHADCYRVDQVVIAPMPAADPARPASATTPDWSTMSAAELHRELEEGLRAVLARELQMPEADLDSDLPFAELGLNSVMAMAIRREVERFAGIELSATMLWNHPTVAALAEHLGSKLAPADDDSDDAAPTDEDSVLDALFDSVESAS